MPYIEIVVAEIEHGDDEDRSVKVPAKWCICGTCDGEGKHSRAMGSYTRDEMDEQGIDFQNDYMSGFYDRQCETCDGSGKILEIDYAAPMTAEQKAAVTKRKSDAEIDAELDALHAAEIAFGC